jgi:hypothetical protein
MLRIFKYSMILVIVFMQICVGVSYESYFTWHYSMKAWDAVTVDNLLLVVSESSSSGYIYCYQIADDGNIHRLDSFYVSGGDPELITANENYAWIVKDSSPDILLSVGITDHGYIYSISEIEIGPFTRGLSILGDWLILNSSSSTNIYSVADTGIPHNEQTYNFSWDSRITVSDGMLLNPTNEGGAALIINDDGSLSTVSNFPESLNIVSAAACDGLYYFLALDDEYQNELYVYNSDCSEMQASLSLAETVTGITVDDGIIVTDGYDGLDFYTLEFGALLQIGSSRWNDDEVKVEDFHDGRMIAIWDDYQQGTINLADVGDFLFFDPEQNQEMLVAENTSILRINSNLHAQGSAEEGLRIQQQLPGENLQTISVLNQLGETIPLWSDGNLLAVSHGMYQGLSLIDISNPAAAEIVSHCQTPDTPNNAVRYGNYLYIADDPGAAYVSGLHIYDISDISNPQHIGNPDLEMSVERLSIDGNILAISGLASSNYTILRTFSLENPVLPAYLDGWGQSYENVIEHLFYDNQLVCITSNYMYLLTFPEMEIILRTWVPPNTMKMIPDYDGFYLITADNNSAGYAYYYTQGEGDSLNLVGAIECFGLIDAAPVGDHLWSVRRNAEGIFSLVDMPAHFNPVTPYLDLEYQNGQLEFKMTGAFAPGDYILWYSADGESWQELLRRPCHLLMPVYESIPLIEFESAAFFRLTMDVQIY